MAVPHQVELFIVTSKDKRPKIEDVLYATTTPHAYLTYAKRIGRALMNTPEQHLYVFRLQVPLDVDVLKPEEIESTLEYAGLLGIHKITTPSRIKFIRCGKWRFTSDTTTTELDSGTLLTMYPEGQRLS